MILQDENPNQNEIIDVTQNIREALDIIKRNIGNNEKFTKVYNEIYHQIIYFNESTKKYYTIKENNLEDITIQVNFIDLCKNISEVAYKDPLTQIYNRRKMKEITDEIFNNNLEQDIYIAIIDLDNFKKINDKYGHPDGDKVLVKLVALIQKFIKEPDMLFRYGGEEFTIIFNNKNKNEVLEILKRIKKHINDALFLNEIKCSVSIGVAQKKDTYENTIKLADEALYFVKQNGKNAICCENEYDEMIENQEREKTSYQNINNRQLKKSTHSFQNLS